VLRDAVTFTFDPLTMIVCRRLGVTSSNSERNWTISGWVIDSLRPFCLQILRGQ